MQSSAASNMAALRDSGTAEGVVPSWKEVDGALIRGGRVGHRPRAAAFKRVKLLYTAGSADDLVCMAPVHRLEDLRREALAATAGLSEGQQALIDALRDLQAERGRAAEGYRAVVQSLTAALEARDGYTSDHGASCG
jgi:hypothetical protein